MDQLIMQETFTSIYNRERRKMGRYSEVYLLVITGRGTGKVLDIGREGLSFGCLYHHAFPPVWSLDIINARGVHLKNLGVRKIWEKINDHTDLSCNFELEIGVEFIDLTPGQENELDIFLNNMDCVEVQHPCLL